MGIYRNIKYKIKKYFFSCEKRCYSVTELNYIDISTLLGQNTVTEGCYRGVTAVTKSLDLSKHLCGFKKYKNIKNNTNEEKKNKTF